MIQKRRETGAFGIFFCFIGLTNEAGRGLIVPF